MYVIHYTASDSQKKGLYMKRTQLYIEENLFKILQDISHEQMVSISELVRKAIKKAYSKETPANADTIMEKAAGIWKNRKDITSADSYVRRMRHDTRRERFGIK